MIEATTIDGARRAIRDARAAGRQIGLVPTMGALHAGHASLVEIARARGAFVVLSIFVNPTQFAPGEDFESYPRNLEKDRAAARAAGVDLLFLPSRVEMYPPGFQTRVTVPELAAPLCGRSRPGHFDGVALVVTKLLNIVRPDFSVFGSKDAQQAILIRRLAADLHLPGEIVLAPTVREADGLAMSSRNAYLAPHERRAAAAISRGLFAARDAYERGERDGGRLVQFVRGEIEREELLAPEYVEIVDRETLGPWMDAARPALLAVAARCGKARLIDNVFLGGAAGGMAIILAAGEGKRMKSDLPKVLHEAAGLPLLGHVGKTARACGFDRIVVVIGNGADRVRARFADEGWEFVEQTERLGTGDAVRRARRQIEGYKGDVVVLAGDAPLLRPETLARLRETHRESGAAVTVLSANLSDPHGYGRIVRDASGAFVAIVEEKDATPAQRAITEVNSSVYCFDAGDLAPALDALTNENAQREYYLTDAVSILRGRNRPVAAVLAAAPEEILGVNTPDQLAEVETVLARRARENADAPVPLAAGARP